MDPVTGKPKANCKAAAECTVGRDRPPKPTTRPLDPATGGLCVCVRVDVGVDMCVCVGAGMGVDVGVELCP